MEDLCRAIPRTPQLTLTVGSQGSSSKGAESKQPSETHPGWGLPLDFALVNMFDRV